MKVRRGEVVLVDYLFSDRTGSKVRPCLVIQADNLNTRLDDTILAVISSNTSRGVNEPTQFMIDVSTSDGAQSGLLFNSAVQCENLATVDCRFIRRKIGGLNSSLMTQVELCLKAALEISP
jgi:mRNA interferase MazF